MSPRATHKDLKLMLSAEEGLLLLLRTRETPFPMEFLLAKSSVALESVVESGYLPDDPLIASIRSEQKAIPEQVVEAPRREKERKRERNNSNIDTLLLTITNDTARRRADSERIGISLRPRWHTHTHTHS